jgi:predicted 2-oxoglutarate/Fe(II)-dependent dioxygenase YbiX
MAKITQLKEEFFKDNISYDINKDSEYGLVPLQMDSSKVELVLKEALDYGQEIKEKYTKIKKFRPIRQVEAWSLDPKDSFTAELLHYALIDINNIFNYKLSKIEGISYLEYSEGCKYDWHTDIGSGLQSMRKISVSWGLNTGYIGGDLQFFGDGGEVITMNTTPEKLVSFTSFIPHRVTPVTKGIRKCIVAWVLGDSWR